ncbi:bcl-2-like protein 13 [Parambassis ranga]|uniref:Bcl-2-like protein 13 n=1 Tax=Parambassis ranga TaxID=210632 RepID=A0A6P7HWF8_9TELE|nr:bcl-2-like protein 13 [Parambassis ranga]
MGDADHEDTKSLDSSEGAVLTGEENHSSNSDMVHLEREEAEMMEEPESEVTEMDKRRTEEEEEEDEDLQTSVMSVLGGEKELVELREEEEQDLQAPETEGLLVSAEEPHMESEPKEFRHVVPPMALPPLPILRLDPPSTTSTPTPSTTTSEVEQLYSTQGLHPPSILAPVEVEPPALSLEPLTSSQIPPSDVDKHSAKEHEVAAEKLEPQPAAPKTKPLSSTELLCGSAALVAVMGVVAYGAVLYCRK